MTSKGTKPHLKLSQHELTKSKFNGNNRRIQMNHYMVEFAWIKLYISWIELAMSSAVNLVSLVICTCFKSHHVSLYQFCYMYCITILINIIHRVFVTLYDSYNVLYEYWLIMLDYFFQYGLFYLTFVRNIITAYIKIYLGIW